jgi:hypothetical protein
MRLAAVEPPRRPLSPKNILSYRRPNLLSFPQGRIRREFQKFFFSSLNFLLRILKQRQFGNVYRLSYPGSIYSVGHFTVRQFSLGYILPLRRAFIPNSQGVVAR